MWNCKTQIYCEKKMRNFGENFVYLKKSEGEIFRFFVFAYVVGVSRVLVLNPEFIWRNARVKTG